MEVACLTTIRALHLFANKTSTPHLLLNLSKSRSGRSSSHMLASIVGPSDRHLLVRGSVQVSVIHSCILEPVIDEPRTPRIHRFSRGVIHTPAPYPKAQGQRGPSLSSPARAFSATRRFHGRVGFQSRASTPAGASTPRRGCTALSREGMPHVSLLTTQFQSINDGTRRRGCLRSEHVINTPSTV